ncbi:IclR family transcriptional regulator [Emcibacter sp.]|uniref:IclR family transcriptional regulator n=1 Tax=Emcibacter sp. TaxID=1979954 RepID=UPI003A8FA75D
MSGTKTVEKTFAIFTLAVDRRTPLDAREIAEILSLPLATVYRHLAVMEQQGLVHRTKNGLLGPGTALVALLDQHRLHELLSSAARPILDKITRTLNLVAQLGVYEQEMITYLAKSEPQGQEVFTRENEQLEAYCTGIGKLLLSELPETAIETYLEAGPFPPLTNHTITQPHKLRRALRDIRSNGYAVDDGEMEANIFCLAVPVRGLKGEVIAALSATCRDEIFFRREKQRILDFLDDSAKQLTKSLYGKGVGKTSPTPSV